MVTKKTIKKYCHMAIDNIICEGTTDVDLFNYPFELNMLKDNIFQTQICTIVEQAILTGKLSELKLHKLGHVLIPKKSLSDYRKCSLTEIYDEIVYLTLVLIVAGEIEKLRIKKENNRVFSYRYLPDNKGRLFDMNYNYTSFREEVIKKSSHKDNKIMIECDVSNFYDRLNIHRVESILLSSKKIDTDIINLINQVLLFWANRDSYGLPVGSNASRILAEAALVEVDNYLISKHINFCRFVDDYRIFANDAYTAHSHLAILVHCLSREGIYLNTQKTKIKDISEKKEILEDKNEEEKKKLEKNQKEIENSNSTNEQLQKGKIIRGYSGLIPTKFRELSEKQMNKLCENNLDEMIDKAENNLLIEPLEVTELIKTIIAQEKFDMLSRMPLILKKFPQFIPYFVDVMLKKGEKVTKFNRKKIQEDFITWFDNVDTPEYIQVYLVRLYASEIFNNKIILLDLFRKLRRNSGDYIGRALLEALEGKLSRGELLEIREYFYRADNWERRQIVKLIDQEFSEGEKRPFYRDISIYSEDIWLKNMIHK